MNAPFAHPVHRISLLLPTPSTQRYFPEQSSPTSTVDNVTTKPDFRTFSRDPNQHVQDRRVPISLRPGSTILRCAQRLQAARRHLALPNRHPRSDRRAQCPGPGPRAFHNQPHLQKCTQVLHSLPPLLTPSSAGKKKQN